MPRIRSKRGGELKGPWYYVYTNRKILLYVDQNGPVKLQYQPPNGILVFKREMGENQSKWQVWVQSKDLNSGVPVSNFCSPNLRYDLPKPKFTSKWTPERAIYTASYDNADIVTEIFVPSDKATACMKTTVINTSGKAMDFRVTPAVFPYVNIPQMVAWDLPEWYLSTNVKRMDSMLTFHGQMISPEQQKELNRSITFNVDYDENARIELSMEDFCDGGNFFAPGKVLSEEALSIGMPDADGQGYGSRQAVYAACYNFRLAAGERKTLTQVLTVQEDVAYNEEENLFEKAYFDETLYANRVEATKKYYDDLFHTRKIKTQNELYNLFINTFAPLQMMWVGALDRGWPSSMRGIRDASQDFMGILPLDVRWTKETILEMLLHQRKDGWMPRQISTVSRQAPHDMRYYCDGGAFLLELMHEYLTFTRDASILDEKVMWLDSDERSTVLEHIERCTKFYLEKHNIGEHGLCKVWYGDWWDPMDKIGTDGIGESVTVTAQMILNLKNLSDMYRWLYKTKKADEAYIALADKYFAKRDAFIESISKHAYNKEGFFNGYFNDNGKWLLSDKDPDGESRIYLVSNAWALIAGFTSKETQKCVIENVERESFGRVGYNLSSKGFPVYIDKAGRKGNGNSPGTGSYNHAQCFWVRALCACGEAELAYKATRYILPIEEAYAPVEKTMAPPYAITNMYSNSDKFLKRGGFQFLSGTVSYVLRTVYNFFFGIKPAYDGLILNPCIPSAFGCCQVEFTYLGKHFEIEYIKAEGEEKQVLFHKKKHDFQIDEHGKIMAFFADEILTEHNQITVYY